MKDLESRKTICIYVFFDEHGNHYRHGVFPPEIGLEEMKSRLKKEYVPPKHKILAYKITADHHPFLFIARTNTQVVIETNKKTAILD